MTRVGSDCRVLWRIIPSGCNSLSEEYYVLIYGTEHSPKGGAKGAKYLLELHPKL